MEITFFGLIWICILSIVFFKGRLRTAIGVVLFSSMLQCSNVVVIGETGVGPFLFSSIFFIIYCLFHKSHISNTKSKATNYIILSFLIFLLYVCFNAYCYNKLDKQGLVIMQVFIYFVCAILMYKKKDVITDNGYVAIIKNIILFQVIFAPIQLLVTKGLLPRFLLDGLFFNEQNQHVYFHTMGYSRVLGTFMEPSFFSSFIVGAFFFIFHFRHYIHKSKFILLAIIVELVLTRSSTGYATFAIVFFLYGLFQRNRKLIMAMIPFLIGGLIFFYATKDTLLKEDL